MTLVRWHAVLVDETGCEFGADVWAESRTEAWDALDEEYPESNVVQLESPQDTADRERRMHQHIARGGDWDDEGRPIYHYDYDEEED